MPKIQLTQQFSDNPPVNPPTQETDLTLPTFLYGKGVITGNFSGASGGKSLLVMWGRAVL
jgi:hypothetical protein